MKTIPSDFSSLTEAELLREIERLRGIVERSFPSQTKAAKELNLTQASLSRLLRVSDESRVTSSTYKNAEQLANRLKMHEIESAISKPEWEESITDRATDTHPDAAVVDGHGGIYRLNPPERYSETMSYPFLESGPSAGTGGTQWDDGERITVPATMAASWAGGRRVPEAEAYWTRVQGDSMEPFLTDQSAIFVEKTNRVGAPGRYVIWVDEAHAEIVKRVELLGGGYLRISSDNPSHATQTLRHVEDDLFEDVALGSKLRLRIRGRVLYPSDTSRAILDKLGEMVRPLPR